MDPFKLFFRTLETPAKVKRLAGRAYSVNNIIVYKYDDNPNANELAFITSLFGKLCKIRSPNLVFTMLNYYIEDGTVHHEPRGAQIMDYLPQWRNYSRDHPKDDKFVKQLAELLAFDLVVGNGDRFVFIFRRVDDLIFVDDPEYIPQSDQLWDDPVINEGNFGFVDGDLWSLDTFPAYTPEQLTRFHSSLTHEFLVECTELISQYFKLSNDQMALFHRRLTKQLGRNLKEYPIFRALHTWIEENAMTGEEGS